MAERITRPMVTRAFNIFLDTLHGDDTEAKSKYTLDYIASYGGFCIESLKGGRPFGNKRMSPKEMYWALNFATDAIKIARPEK
jgi:hypothetical protein